MELDFIKKTEKIQILLFDVIGEFLQKFANKIIVTYDTEEKFNKLEVSVSNKSNSKTIIFYYSEGLNIDNEFIRLYLFSIETEKKEGIKRNKFYMQDYAQLKGLPYNQFIPAKYYYNYEEKLVEVFEQVKLILEDVELSKVLYADEWIEVPIDLEPYK